MLNPSNKSNPILGNASSSSNKPFVQEQKVRIDQLYNGMSLKQLEGLEKDNLFAITGHMLNAITSMENIRHRMLGETPLKEHFYNYENNYKRTQTISSDNESWEQQLKNIHKQTQQDLSFADRKTIRDFEEFTKLLVKKYSLPTIGHNHSVLYKQYLLWKQAKDFDQLNKRPAVYIKPQESDEYADDTLLHTYMWFGFHKTSSGFFKLFKTQSYTIIDLIIQDINKEYKIKIPLSLNENEISIIQIFQLIHALCFFLNNGLLQLKDVLSLIKILEKEHEISRGPDLPLFRGHLFDTKNFYLVKLAVEFFHINLKDTLHLYNVSSEGLIEHRISNAYGKMTLQEIQAITVDKLAVLTQHVADTLSISSKIDQGYAYGLSKGFKCSPTLRQCWQNYNDRIRQILHTPIQDKVNPSLLDKCLEEMDFQEIEDRYTHPLSFARAWFDFSQQDLFEFSSPEEFEELKMFSKLLLNDFPLNYLGAMHINLLTIKLIMGDVEKTLPFSIERLSWVNRFFRYATQNSDKYLDTINLHPNMQLGFYSGSSGFLGGFYKDRSYTMMDLVITVSPDEKIKIPINLNDAGLYYFHFLQITHTMISALSRKQLSLETVLSMLEALKKRYFISRGDELPPYNDLLVSPKAVVLIQCFCIYTQFALEVEKACGSFQRSSSSA